MPAARFGNIVEVAPLAGVVKLRVGGTTPSRIARVVAISSKAPLAPRAWPWAALVEDTARRSACGPKTWRMAHVSLGSLAQVPVPWALM